MKSELQISLERRFGDVFQRENFYVATFLDSRYKILYFSKDISDQIVAGVKNIIRQYAVADENPDFSEELDYEDDVPLYQLQQNLLNKSNSSKNTFWETFNSIASTAQSQTRTAKKITQKWEEEITLYLASPAVSKDKSPFEWWQAEKEKYPSLYKAALTYLSAPAGSVSSEQLFSDLGNIYEPKRNRLNGDRAEMLLFLHHNIKKLEFKY